MKNDCLTCIFNQDASKAPGGRIKEYEYWILEHINEPIPVLGWLVLKTKRHTEGVVGLNKNEAKELGHILHVVPKALKKIVQAENIHIISMNELVKHIHIHIIPRCKKDEVDSSIISLMDKVKENKDLAKNTEDAKKIVEKLYKKL